MPQEIRLLIYSPLSLQVAGGGEKWLIEVAPRLKLRGIEPTLLVTEFVPKGYESVSSQWHLEQLEDTRIRHVNIGTIGLFQKANLPVLKPQSFLELIRLLSIQDIAYFMNAYAFQDFTWALAKRLSGNKPVICSQHAALYGNDRLHNLYVSAMTRAIIRQFDAYHVLNEYDYSTYETWGLQNVFLIPNGVDTQKFSPPSVKENDSLRILYVGRLGYKKGIDIFLEAISTLSEKNPKQSHEIIFTICGAGPESKTVQEFAKKHENVEYLGYVNEERLAGVYSSSDLFVMPSRSETFGIVIAEAMASGLPIIAADIAGPRSIVEDSFGRLIPPDDVPSLVNTILELHGIWSNDQEKYRIMGEVARTTSVTKYDWNSVIDRFVEMIQVVLERNGKST